jgi:hypothetical protein
MRCIDKMCFQLLALILLSSGACCMSCMLSRQSRQQPC